MLAQFVKVCPEADIEEGKIRVFTMDNEPIVLGRCKGKIFALEGICTHDGGEFEDGEHLIDCQIECPRHGARFDANTGEVTRMPAVVGIGTYDVVLENGDIYVALSR